MEHLDAIPLLRKNLLIQYRSSQPNVLSIVPCTHQSAVLGLQHRILIVASPEGPFHYWVGNSLQPTEWLPQPPPGLMDLSASCVPVLQQLEAWPTAGIRMTKPVMTPVHHSLCLILQKPDGYLLWILPHARPVLKI